MFADRVPDLVSVTGPVAACGGQRGTFAYGNGGYAMLGQLIADVTGSRYEDAATRMVLEPPRDERLVVPPAAVRPPWGGAGWCPAGILLTGRPGRDKPGTCHGMRASALARVLASRVRP